MTKSRVVLPKRVAETIEYLREERRVSDHTIYLIATSSIDIHSDEAIHLRKYVNIGTRKTRYLELMDALANGWEVEQTPEDSLREYFETAERSRRIFRKKFEYTAADARYDAIITTLNKLGITIEGINDR